MDWAYLEKRGVDTKSILRKMYMVYLLSDVMELFNDEVVDECKSVGTVTVHTGDIKELMIIKKSAQRLVKSMDSALLENAENFGDLSDGLKEWLDKEVAPMVQERIKGYFEI